MQLVSFRVFNFRSINDSGVINVDRVTSLLGRNESGKSNLLLALSTLNPIDGFEALDPIKDFPRHRRLEECTDATIVLKTIWKLNPAEQIELGKILPRAKALEEVTVDRSYTGEHRYIGFPKLNSIDFNETDIKAKVRKVVPAVKAAADKLDAEPKAALEAAADAFDLAVAMKADRSEWAQAAISGAAALRKALATADADLSEKQDDLLGELEELAETVAGDKDAQTAARKWVLKSLPKFILLDEYPDFDGHQNISDFLARKSDNKLSAADKNFQKLCKVAGLDAAKLNSLLNSKEQEARNQLTNRASAIVTKEIRRVWKDRALKIRFNLDAQFFDTLISDPTGTFDVEVNLNERSRGFKWFFSFYVTFAADTAGGEAANAILLLDEPGLYLHAKSQTDLLAHLNKDFANQILYTTHSPFMVPTDNLTSIRTVSITEEKGTTVTNDPAGDARTLFPLQAALGYDLAQSLFIGPNNLVIEGVTDFWILSSISNYLHDSGKRGLSKEITLTPAGGAQKVSYMVALLSSEQLNVVVLLDDEKESRTTRDDLVRSKLIREQNVVFVSEAVDKTKPAEMDIEDLLDPGIYEKLVRESYEKELKGKTLKLNNQIPRIAKRFEAAFSDIGIDFFKTRPTRLLLSKMASEPATVVDAATISRFESLASTINDRMKKHIERDAKAFT